MKKRIFLGVQVTKQVEQPLAVQEILTRHSRNIKTRLGLHEPEAKTRTLGLLLIECCGNLEEIKELENGLKNIPGVSVKKMIFQE